MATHSFHDGRSAGHVVITQGVQPLAADPVRGIEVGNCLLRHLKGDWGDVPDEDKASNDVSFKTKNMLLSAYTVHGTAIWIITDPGWEVTTILLPDEY